MQTWPNVKKVVSFITILSFIFSNATFAPPFLQTKVSGEGRAGFAFPYEKQTSSKLRPIEINEAKGPAGPGSAVTVLGQALDDATHEAINKDIAADFKSGKAKKLTLEELQADSVPIEALKYTDKDGTVKYIDVIIVPSLDKHDSFLVAHPGRGGVEFQHNLKQIRFSPKRYAAIKLLSKEAQKQLWRHEAGHLTEPYRTSEEEVQAKYPINKVLAEGKGLSGALEGLAKPAEANERRERGVNLDAEFGRGIFNSYAIRRQFVDLLNKFFYHASNHQMVDTVQRIDAIEDVYKIVREAERYIEEHNVTNLYALISLQRVKRLLTVFGTSKSPADRLLRDISIIFSLWVKRESIRMDAFEDLRTLCQEHSTQTAELSGTAQLELADLLSGRKIPSPDRLDLWHGLTEPAMPFESVDETLKEFKEEIASLVAKPDEINYLPVKELGDTVGAVASKIMSQRYKILAMLEDFSTEAVRRYLDNRDREIRQHTTRPRSFYDPPSTVINIHTPEDLRKFITELQGLVDFQIDSTIIELDELRNAIEHIELPKSISIEAMFDLSNPGLIRLTPQK